MPLPPDHYTALAVGYGSALALTLLIDAFRRSTSAAHPPLWPAVQLGEWRRPGLELLLGFSAAAAVVLLGQCYVRYIRLPNSGSAAWFLETVNQAIIFAPFPLLLLARRQPFDSALISSDRVPRRLLIGFAISLFSLTAYCLARFQPHSIPAVFAQVFSVTNLPHAVQVLGEDFAIAFMFVRLAASLKSFRAAGIAVIVLFVLAHIPALVTTNAWTVATALDRVRDIGIGVIVVAGLIRTRDLFWLWPLHTVMDLTQFATPLP